MEANSNREIAARLGLSQHTIKNYLFRVFDKLGVSSRLELLSITLSQPLTHLAASRQVLANSSIAGEATLAWFQKAAEQGQPAAQIALAQLYAQGQGVAKDAVSAYMWYLVSERTSVDLKEEISAAKERLAESLTNGQLVEAQTRASDRLKKPPKTSSQVPGVASSSRANF